MGILPDGIRARVKAAIETMHDGICTVYGKLTRVDPATKRTVTEDAVIYADQPCHVSYSYTNQVQSGSSDGMATVEQVIKLFVAPELIIPAGSKIVVLQRGTTQTYDSSGEPAKYDSHQEIRLTIREELK